MSDWISEPSRMNSKQEFMCYSRDLNLHFEIEESEAVPVQYRCSTGVALFCPECAEIWARIGPVSKGDLTGWQSRPRRCREHGNGLLAAHNIVGALPKEILHHDFLLILEHLENKTPELYWYQDMLCIIEGIKHSERTVL